MAMFIILGLATYAVAVWMLRDMSKPYDGIR